MVEEKPVYYDFTRGEHYFSITENDPGFSHVFIEGNEIGLKFRKTGDIYWVSFMGETKRNEKIKDMLKGKDLRSIKSGMLFPIVLNKNGRAYYFYQYNENVEAEVTEHLLKLQNAFDEIHGIGSFKIEKISDAENPTELFNYGSVNELFYEIEILVPYEGPDMKGIQKRISMNPEENEFIIKH